MTFKFLSPSLLIIAMLSLINCKKKSASELILGAWQIDSTYTYYNGFEQTRTEESKDWATYVYNQKGLMNEIKKGALQSYFFNIKDGEKLDISSTRGGAEIQFEILKIDENQLVLKKIKAPLFGGTTSQERYEIRYFSRTEAPVDAPATFNDPRGASK